MKQKVTSFILAVLIILSALPVLSLSVFAADDVIEDGYKWFWDMYYDEKAPYNYVYGESDYKYECYVKDANDGVLRVVFYHQGKIVRNEDVIEDLLKMYFIVLTSTDAAKGMDSVARTHWDAIMNNASVIVENAKALKINSFCDDVAKAGATSLGSLTMAYATGGATTVASLVAAVGKESIKNLSSHFIDIKTVIADAQMTMFYLNANELEECIEVLNQTATDIKSFQNCELYFNKAKEVYGLVRSSNAIFEHIAPTLETNTWKLLGKYSLEFVKGFVGNLSELDESFDKIAEIQKYNPSLVAKLIQYASELGQFSKTYGIKEFYNYIRNTDKTIQGYVALYHAVVEYDSVYLLEELKVGTKLGLLDYPEKETVTPSTPPTPSTGSGSSASTKIPSEGTFASIISTLKDKYPDKKYWNQYNGTEKIGNETVAKAGDKKCPGTSSYNNKTCSTNGYCAYKGYECTCKCGYYYGWQCFGFANLLAYHVFGSYASKTMSSSGVNTAKGWTYKASVSEYYAGDIVRINNNSHSIFITKVTNSTVYYADCNASAPCQIRWDKTISIKSLKEKTSYVFRMKDNNLKGNVANTLTINYSANGGTVAAQYKVSVGDSVLQLRSSANTSSTILAKIPDKTVIIVTEIKEAGKYTWGKTTYDGKVGWCALDYTVRQGYYANDDILYKYSSSAKATTVWNYGSGGENGLYNAKTFGLTKDGYVFAGWSKSTNGSLPIFDENDTELKAEDIDPSVASGSKTITLYAVWKVQSECEKGHDLIHHNAQAPTCTAPGWAAYDTCSRCDHTTFNELPATGHTPAPAVEENRKEATCTTDGSYDSVIYCSTCKAEVSRTTEKLPATGHTPAPAVEENRKEATCTVDGSYDSVVYCSTCEAEVSRTTEKLPATGHTPAPAVEENRKEATCTADGSYDSVVYCSTCKAEISRITEKLPATGHTPAPAVEENRKEATCTTDGAYDSVVYCSTCKAEVSRETKVLPATGHTPAPAVEENRKEATCTTDGSYDSVVYCSTCKAEVSRTTEKLPATGHTPAPAVEENRKEATCTTDGSYDSVVYCSTCKAEISRITEKLPATGHTPAPAIEENRKEATCTTDGSYDSVVYCSTCEVEVSRTTEKIPATGHTPAPAVEENRKEATCTTDGSYDSVIYCSTCKAEVSRETKVLPATGHTPAPAVEENRKEATCTTDGSYDSVVYCSTCKAEVSRTTEKLPATGHTSAPAVEENRKEATCTTDGSYDSVVYCSTCKAEVSRTTEKLPATGHTPAPAVEENRKEATCTTDGSYDSVIYCSTCKAEISRITEKLPATGHTPAPAIEENRKEATCTTDGSYDSVVYCSTCKAEVSRETKVLPATGHSHVATVTAPTCTEQGYTTHTCHCGDTHVDTYAPATGHTEVIDPSKEPTCTESGLTEGKHCSVCDEILIAQETVEALGHTEGEWETVISPAVGVEGKEHLICSTCGIVLEERTILAFEPDTDSDSKPTAETDQATSAETAAPSPTDGCQSSASFGSFMLMIIMIGAGVFVLKKNSIFSN